jgi:steroid 5-alpha reductase family enzyme
MSLLYVVAVLRKNNSIADIGYGVGFIIVAVSSMIQNGGSWYSSLATLLIMFWGFRLALRIGIRNFSKPEDFRYVGYREKWKYFYLRSYFQVFIFQGLIIYIISLPVLFINLYPKQPTLWLLVLGVIVWAIGYFFEVVGDYQLDEFLKLAKKPSKYLTTGLWSKTRHPNYFGESTMWVGLFIFSLSSSRYGIYTIISPILITFLLTKVSGIPMVEKRHLDDPVWQKYAKSTPAFIPKLFK